MCYDQIKHLRISLFIKQALSVGHLSHFVKIRQMLQLFFINIVRLIYTAANSKPMLVNNFYKSNGAIMI